jgi:hypothetical protein
MADFARWGSACEGALWQSGAFAAAYAENRAKAAESTLDADVVASAVRTLLAEGEPCWEGTATGLLSALNRVAGDTVTRSRDWPKVPNVLSGGSAGPHPFCERPASKSSSVNGPVASEQGKFFSLCRIRHTRPLA